MPVRVEPGAEPIPGYKLIDRLGGGGFGEVWKAEAPGGLLKAIKVVYGDLHTTDPDGTKRAEQELKAMKRVQSVRHPYLLSLERYDIIEGRLLIVMELADRNLWDRFRECRSQNLQGIPRDELMRYMDETAEVLDLMNTQYQLQHLDIKPQNLFLVHNHAKVADFGLVKDLEGMMATVTGGITPVYAAPETFDGKVSRFCDQYSLAIVYQELLTGQRPFSGNSLQQLIMQHLSAQPNLAPLPKADRPAIARSLSKKPEGRFPSCTDLVRALRAAGDGSALRAAPPMVTVEVPVPVEAPPASDGLAAPDSAPDSSLTAGRTPPPSTPVVIVETEQPLEESKPLRPAPPKVTGEGVLYPALVIGLGQKGLEALQTLRGTLDERFGAQPLPSLKLLYVDTDPEPLQAGALNPAEAYIARLNRAGHYVKPVSGRPSFDSWFNSKLIYRIPRNPATTGMRCLGRLAFVDHYRNIAARLHADLEACTRPDALANASKATKLGLRCNYPRVYIVSSLTGGTGSGCFLDMAYVVRSELRKLGYLEPDVIGVLFLPQPEAQGNSVLALGNAYAALTELRYFSDPEHTFAFRFDDKGGRIKDPAPPFNRCLLLPLEAENDKQHAGATARLAGDFLCRELTTALGRTAEECRPVVESAEPRIAFQTIGMHRFTWPRQELIQRAARRVTGRILQRWLSKDPPQAVKEGVKNWLTKELTRHEMEAEHLITALQDACEKELGQSPDSLFDELVEPFVPQGKRGPDLDALVATVQRMEELVGSTEPEPAGKRRPVLLAEAIEQAGEAVSRKWTARASQLVFRFVEDVHYRVRGAEEAVRMLTGLTEDTLDTYEPLLQEREENAVEARKSIQELITALEANPNGGRRNAPLIAELVDALRLYPRCRYQSLLLRRVINVYVTLRGKLSDLIRELTFIRQRLGELAKTFEYTGEMGDLAPASGAPATNLLPAGCETMDDAVNGLVRDIKPDAIHALDQAIQTAINQQLTSLVQGCMTSGTTVKSLEELLHRHALDFTAQRLTSSNVVEMFQAHYEDNEDGASNAIVNAYQDAVPELARKLSCTEPELRMVALPAGEHVADFRELVRKALPNMQLLFTDSPDDIVICREQPEVPLDKLPLLGPVGQNAYRQMSNADNFSPHSREDIPDWQPAETE
ncbi:MAG: protein kinase [Planctomycetia bacterium]|nr:protein kinase [Planctomycetia bacterium]